MNKKQINLTPKKKSIAAVFFRGFKLKIWILLTSNSKDFNASNYRKTMKLILVFVSTQKSNVSE